MSTSKLESELAEFLESPYCYYKVLTNKAISILGGVDDWNNLRDQFALMCDVSVKDSPKWNNKNNLREFYDSGVIGVIRNLLGDSDATIYAAGVTGIDDFDLWLMAFEDKTPNDKELRSICDYAITDIAHNYENFMRCGRGKVKVKSVWDC